MQLSLSLADSSERADAAKQSILLLRCHQTSRFKYQKVCQNSHRFSCCYKNSKTGWVSVPSAAMKYYTQKYLLCLLNPELHPAGKQKQLKQSHFNEVPREYKDRDNCSFVSLHINLTNFCQEVQTQFHKLMQILLFFFFC